MNVCNTHEIQVTVVSPGEAEYGTAEFWSGGKLSIANATAEANRLLALY